MRGKFVICYILHMDKDFLPVDSFFELRLKWLLPSAAVVFIAVLLFSSQKMLLQLPGPAAMTLAFMIFLMTACRLTSLFTDHLTRSFRISYPTIVLWLYPTLTMLLISFTAWLFLTASGRILGRGFWSDWLGLTGQDTTSFFFNSFAAMMIFISLQFAFSLLRVLNWILEIPQLHMQAINARIDPHNPDIHCELGAALDLAREQSRAIREKRCKATRLNRFALLLMVLAALAIGAWITFFNPALILYYRAEIQLRTFLEPQTARETFRHLREKHPKYRFIDTVEYRMAWILDRRLKNHERAAIEYENFLKKFGSGNVWADEAVAALVRLNLDKLQKPAEALVWVEKYLQLFPHGVMTLHMRLYKIRALQRLGNTDLAKAELAKARKLYASEKIQIINSEDRLVDLISFADALNAEALLTALDD